MNELKRNHLPLYCQERIYSPPGPEIPRSTLTEWVGAFGVQLQPLAANVAKAVLVR